MQAKKKKVFGRRSLGPREAKHNYRNKPCVKVNNDFKLVWGAGI